NTTQLDIYDPNNNSWSQGAPAPAVNRTATAGLIGNEIIVVGGSSEYGNYGPPYFNSVWIYDTANNSWDPNGVVLPAGRRNPVSGVSGSAIYVFGGATNVPEEEAWKGVVDVDSDMDGILDGDDNCPNDANMDQADMDMD